MKQVPFFIRVFNVIKNFLKMLFLYIIKFILIILGLEDKEEKINKEIIVVTKNIKNNKEDIRYGDYVPPVDPSSLITSSDSDPDRQKKLKETIIYKHISNDVHGNVYVFSVTLEMLDKLIDEYLEEKENIKVEEVSKELKEDIKEWKEEIIIPQVKDEFKEKYISNKDILVTSLNKILDKELEIQHKKVQDKKERIIEGKDDIKDIKTNPITRKKDKDSIVVDFKEELKVFDAVSKDDSKSNESSLNELKNDVISSDTILDIPVPVKNEVQLKDEITNILYSSALLASSIEKVLLEDKVKQSKKDKEEVINKDVTLVEKNDDIIEDKKDDIKEVNIVSQDVKEEFKEEKKIPEIIIEDKKKIDHIEELEQVEEIVELKKLETKKEELLSEIVIKPVDLPDVDINNESILDKARDESYKEDIEDRDYDSLESKIDQALERIEMFIIMNEGKLSKEQLEQLNKEKEKLEHTKDKINQQREFDIEVEKKHLEEKIARSELDGLQEKLKQMKLENDIAMQKLMINRLEDLEYMSDARAREIEKQLLKLKLREACRALAIPSLFALPFVRNKYFFFFSVGMMVNRSLGFIGNIFRRHTPEESELELNNLVQGKDALYNALDMTKENLDYLNILEQQALIKYPELAKDSEYLAYISSLKHKLTNNYNRLTRRQNTIDRLIYRTKRNVKTLKRKKKKYERNAA